MSFVFEVPREYGYVLAVATSTIFVNTYHKTLASIARKASGIKYPTPYATQEQAEKDPKAYKFNLAQRAHSNFTENLTPFLTGLLIAGLRYPGPAAYAGTAWVAGRFAYAYAYTNFGPSGRLPGYVVSQLGKVALTTMAVLTCYNMVRGA
ncbi:membrane-associated proteins in eicosanoid and glutathione metabolism [Xylariaceae sp. AK1471]|nr:membrane-associated proteins in eicosanoid and glutathione metabolism [Xylariaceae sp. AK1471]